MNYQSEVNNSGHDQYFTNVENTSDLQKVISALTNILPPKLISNFQMVYKAYLTLDEKAEDILEQCDDVFYENEGNINRLL